MSKRKGDRAERELIHMFFSTGKFAPLRTAGSGSTSLPCPDLLVGGMGRVLAIECKSSKNKKYIRKEQVDELVEFSTKFGAEPWIGMRFDGKGWFFLDMDNLKMSKGNSYAIDLKLALEKGLSFEKLVNSEKIK